MPTLPSPFAPSSRPMAPARDLQGGRAPRALSARLGSVALAAVLTASLVACGGGKEGAASAPAGGGGGGGAGGGAPQGLPVSVITVQLGSVGMGTELPGRLEARRAAQVRARVVGIIQKRSFEEGSLVRAGQPLFTLDSDVYRASLATAQAAAQNAQAQLAQANAQVERNRPLAEARAISQQEWLATQTAARQAQAALASANAQIAAARVPVGQATVTAPISGRIGRANVSEGSLVGPTDPTPLATIQQTDPLYVNITQSAADYLKLRRSLESGRAQAPSGTAARMQVLLDDGTVHAGGAKLLFADPTVDPTTGQMTIRAEIGNPNGMLLPGMFVRVRQIESVASNAALIPQQAVTRGGAKGDTVLVVGPDKKAAPRVVQIAQAQGSDWVVTGGLSNGDQVIVEGFQMLQMRPGMPLMPIPWQRPGTAAPAAAPGTAPAASGAAPAAPSASGAPAAPAPSAPARPASN